MNKTYKSSSPDQTNELAKNILGDMDEKGIKVALLVGDLGTGKTTLTRGFVGALGGDISEVSSPTFTLHNVYDCGDKMVNHYDLYRLLDLGIMIDEIIESSDQSNALTFIEWPPKSLPGDLGQHYMTIKIDRCNGEEDSRIFALSSSQ